MYYDPSTHLSMTHYMLDGTGQGYGPFFFFFLLPLLLLVSLSLSPVFDSVYTPSKWNICPLRALFDYEPRSHLSSTAAIAASNKNNFHEQLINANRMNNLFLQCPVEDDLFPLFSLFILGCDQQACLW
jgi:hypothetical protein